MNDGDHPARAVASSQVRTADRGLGVHRFVLRRISLMMSFDSSSGALDDVADIALEPPRIDQPSRTP